MEFSFLQIVEFIAVVSGMLHVFLLTRGKIIAWPFGLLTVSLYVYIFSVSNLYSDVILHVIYIVLNVYGWWNWSRKPAGSIELRVERSGTAEIFFWSALILAGFVVWGYIMDNNTDADFPYGDAFTTVASLVAQYLLARKKIENWVVWIIVDVVAMNIYAFKGLYLTVGLYGVYLFLSALGFWNWKVLLNKRGF